MYYDDGIAGWDVSLRKQIFMLLLWIISFQQVISQQLNLPLGDSQSDDCQSTSNNFVEGLDGGNQGPNLIGTLPNYSPSTRHVHCIGGGYFVGLRVVYTDLGSLEVASLHCTSGNVNIEGVGRMIYPSVFKLAAKGEEQDVFCELGSGISGFGGLVDKRGLIVGLVLHCTNITDASDVSNVTIGHEVEDAMQVSMCEDSNWDYGMGVSLVKSFLVSFELDSMEYQSHQQNKMYAIGIASCMEMYDLHEKAPRLVSQCDAQCLKSAMFPYAACQWERVVQKDSFLPDCSRSVLGCECEMEEWKDSEGMIRKGGCMRLKGEAISRCPIDIATCPRDANLRDIEIAHERLFDFCQTGCNELIQPLDEILYNEEDQVQYHSVCYEDEEPLDNWENIGIGFNVMSRDGRSGWNALHANIANDIFSYEQPSDDAPQSDDLCLVVNITPPFDEPQLYADKCIRNRTDPDYRSRLFRKISITNESNTLFVVESALYPGLCLHPRGLIYCSQVEQGLEWYDSTLFEYGCNFWQRSVSSSRIRLGGSRGTMSVVPIDSPGVSGGNDVIITMCQVLDYQSAAVKGFVDHSKLSLRLMPLTDNLEKDQQQAAHEVEAKEVLVDILGHEYNSCDHKTGSIPSYCRQENIVCDHLGRVVYLADGEPANNLVQLPQLRAVTLGNKGLLGHFPEFKSPQQSTNLSVLLLQGNRLTGTLPASWSETLASVIYLDISEQMSVGMIPESWSWKSAFNADIQIKMNYDFVCKPPQENASSRFVELPAIPKCFCDSEPFKEVQYQYQVTLRILYPVTFNRSEFFSPVPEEIDELENMFQCQKPIDCQSLMCEEAQWMQQWREIEELQSVSQYGCNGGLNPFWKDCRIERNITKVRESVNQWNSSVKTLFGNLSSLFNGKTRKLSQENKVYMVESVAGLYSMRGDLEGKEGLNQIAQVVTKWFQQKDDDLSQLVGILDVVLVDSIALESDTQHFMTKFLPIIAAAGALLVLALLLGIIFRRRQVRQQQTNQSKSTSPAQPNNRPQSFLNRVSTTPEVNSDLYVPSTIHFVSEDQQHNCQQSIKTPRSPDIDFNIDFANHLKLDEPLGSDEFGTSYKGFWSDKAGVNHQVTIKVFEMSNFELQHGEQDVVAMMREELKSTCLVHHPCLLRYYGGSFNKDKVAIVSEFMDGWSLEQYLYVEKNRLSVRQILQILQAVSRALAYLHPTIVHQGIRPSNILLSQKGIVKVTEYGLANVRSTLIGCVGAPFATASAYEAPEVLRNTCDQQVRTEKVDIYSLGILVWEMCSGQKPLQELGSRLQLLLKIGYEKYRPPLPKECAPVLLDIMTQCWHEDPNLRPSAMEVFRQADLFLKSKSDAQLLRVPSPLVNNDYLPIPQVRCLQMPEQIPTIDESKEQPRQQNYDLERSVTGSTTTQHAQRNHHSRYKHQQLQRYHSDQPRSYWQQVQQDLERGSNQTRNRQHIVNANYYTGLDGSSAENSVNIPNSRMYDGSNNNNNNNNHHRGVSTQQLELLNLGRIFDRQRDT